MQNKYNIYRFCTIFVAVFTITAAVFFVLAQDTFAQSCDYNPWQCYPEENISCVCEGGTDVVCYEDSSSCTPSSIEFCRQSNAAQCQPADFTIRKIVSAGSDPGQIFPFTGTGDWDFNTSFNLKAGEKFQKGMWEGSYTFIEEVPFGWEDPTITCDGGTWSATGSQLDIFIPRNETIVCSYTNWEEPPAEITITKNISSGDTSESFRIYDTTGVIDGIFSNGESQTFLVDGGDYTITEDVPAGWDPPSISCSNGASGTGSVNFFTNYDTSVSCTFSNTETIEPYSYEYEYETPYSYEYEYEYEYETPYSYEYEYETPYSTPYDYEYPTPYETPSFDISCPFATGCSLADIWSGLCRRLIMFATPIFIIMILYAAYNYLVAGAAPQKIKTAKSTLLYGAIGYVILLVACFLPELIASLL